ncbi:unnamed protein product, partial [Angiostrongylus costaricensis]|uniref:Actin-binding lim zn-finger protein limatin involved in axon guidance n=1 Tax=Angiostrongylus costaricensis TaxID=334426 RepID=A0A158PI05_ANGCS
FLFPFLCDFIQAKRGVDLAKKCEFCKKKCSGDVLRANNKYFHIQCFKCKQCSRPLGESGFYTGTDGSYLCPEDYRAVGRGDTQPTASKTPDGATRPTAVNGEQAVNNTKDGQTSPLGSPADCAACGQPLHSGQVLLALGLSWHVYCFKCSECGAVLHGEYMSHDGKPLCLRDYNEKHGVKCYECHKFIAGKVLQAGGYKFHPTCARCSRCGSHFGDGEEMYMQGDEIWHPSCEHARTTENIAPSAKNASLSSRNEPKYQSTFGQHLTYMYLLPEAEQTYLRHPITNPKEPNAPQFHVPQGPIKIRKSRVSMLKTGMQRLTEDLEKNVPRPKSPHMDNEEPIEMAHYPAGHAPDPDKLPAIERDDFPAPPYPYAVEELKKRLSSSSIENEISDDELSESERIDEDKLKKTVEQLEKFDDSSIAHVIKQNIEESHKKQRCHISPSRHLNRPRPWVAWQGGERSQGNTLPCFHVPESRGSTVRAATLPSGYNYGTLSMENLDTTISSQYSDHSLAGTLGVGMRAVCEVRPILRSSLPDMSKPAKIYDLADLQTTNKKLPEDADRQHLERHLARDEFEKLFGMSPIEFYKLPEWKRINLKRKHKLF